MKHLFARPGVLKLLVEPLLAGQFIRRILIERLSANPLAFELTDGDLNALIRMAKGRPGWIIMAAHLLHDTLYWHNGRIARDTLRTDIMTRTAGMYSEGLTGLQTKHSMGSEIEVLFIQEQTIEVPMAER